MVADLARTALTWYNIMLCLGSVLRKPFVLSFLKCLPHVEPQAEFRHIQVRPLPLHHTP